MKKLIALFLILALLGSLAGCAGTTVVVGNCTCPPEAHSPAATPTEAPGVPELSEGSLKTGLAVIADLSGSASATAEANGKADYDVTVVAVTVDGNGVIQSCIIDSVGASAEFDAAGIPADIAPGSTAAAANAVQIQTKNEKGFDYGMVAYNASAIGKEWFEQAAALAQFAVGKTVDEVKAGIAGGYAADADLATSASIYLGGYVAAMEKAVANAKELGAQAGDELKLATINTLHTSVGEAEGGAAELTMDVAAITMNGDVITSAYIDSLQAQVAFDGTGAITSDLSAALTKNEKGFDYGMVAYNASAIGKEWFEQAAAFCAYVTGKTAAEVAGIAITETTKPADGTDLAASVTISIGGFQALIAKAAQ